MVVIYKINVKTEGHRSRKHVRAYARACVKWLIAIFFYFQIHRKIKPLNISLLVINVFPLEG